MKVHHSSLPAFIFSINVFVAIVALSPYDRIGSIIKAGWLRGLTTSFFEVNLGKFKLAVIAHGKRGIYFLSSLHDGHFM